MTSGETLPAPCPPERDGVLVAPPRRIEDRPGPVLGDVRRVPSPLDAVLDPDGRAIWLLRRALPLGALGLIVRGERATSVAVDDRVPEAAIAEVIVHLLAHLRRDPSPGDVPLAACPGRACPDVPFAFWR